MILLHKLHSHVHYEEVYSYKRFPKFSIKTLTKITCQNLKNEQIIGLNHVGVNESRIYHAYKPFPWVHFDGVKVQKITIFLIQLMHSNLSR